MAIGEEASRAYQQLNNLPADLFELFETWHAQITPSGDGQVASLAEFELRDGSTCLDLDSSDASHLVVRFTSLFTSTDAKLAVLLRDAVIRQAEFVDKMNGRMWIRSPALQGTLRRAIARYANFLTLMRLYPGSTIVPTLDIDLVWHTHQCTGAAYVQGMRAIVGRFVNHDDTIARDRLDVGFDASRGFYRVHFAQEYRACGCWDCEALMSELEAVGGDVDMDAVARRVMEEVRYHRAVEVAIRMKRPLPIRS
jgi:hypothetical protein